MNRLIRIIVVASVIAIGNGGQRAGAQEEPRAKELEEIIVTARRREENLMDTPISVTAFSQEELAAKQISSIDQIAESTPGLIFRRNGGQSTITTNIYIRGIGQSDYTPTVQPGVGLYVDGVYLSAITGSLLSVMDIQSVQVLRGPQGSLFGRNTIGGAVLVNSVKPSNEFGGDVDLLVGNFNRQRLKASLNIGFTDRFFGKFSGLLDHIDGFVDAPNINGDDGLGSNDTQAARVALRWLPTDDLTIDFATDYSDIESDGQPRVFGSRFSETDPSGDIGRYNLNVAPVLGTPLFTEAANYRPLESYTSMVGFYIRSNANISSHTLTVEWNIGDVTVKSITNRRDLDTFDAADIDIGGPLVNHTTYPQDGHQFSQEFQLAGTSLGGHLQWLTGVYYFENEIIDRDYVNFATFSLMSGSIADNKSSALFGQITYDFTDQWSLTLGGRFSDEKLDSIVDDRIQYLASVLDPSCTGSCVSPVFGPFGPQPGIDGYRPLPAPPDPGAFRIQPNNVFESDESGFDPQVSLAYRWNEDLMTYISYSEGFKGGGFTQRIIPGVTVDSFGPEYAKVYEIGGKWTGFDNRLRVTGAAFFTDYTDIQVAVTRILGGSIENGGDAEIKGFELELLSAITPQLQLAASVARLDGKYTQLAPTATIPIGSRLPTIMDWQGSASLVYRMPMEAGELVSRVDYSYVGDHYVDRDNLPGNLVPSYSVANASITFAHESGRWELSLEGRNITDELYYKSSQQGPPSRGYSTVMLSPPAQYGARFRYHF